MFEAIKKLDWTKIANAHGYSEHIPHAINGLLFSDKTVQKESYWKLENYVVLQGDLYEAAFYVIPFLLEIVGAENGHGKIYAYDLLFEIANGYASDREKCVLEGETLTLMEGCKRAVLAGKNVFLTEIANSDSAFRTKALDLLTSLATPNDGLPQILLDFKQKEADEAFRTQLSEAIVEIS